MSKRTAKSSTAKSKPSAAAKLAEMQNGLFDQLREDVETFRGSWVRNWAGLTPVNAQTGNAYTGGNSFCLYANILARQTLDPRFVTFNQADKMGAHVKKGSHGIPLTFYKDCYFLVNENRYAKCDEFPQVVLRQMVRNKEAVKHVLPTSTFYVFHAEDVDGLPEWLPSNNTRVHANDALIDALIAAAPCPVYERISDSAYYRPKADYVVMPKRDLFVSADSFVAALLHELAHATGAESRNNRKYGSDPRRRDEDYAREELVAEIGASLAQVALGIELTRDETELRWDNHVAYIQSWLGAFAGKENRGAELARAWGEGVRAAEYLVSALSGIDMRALGCQPSEGTPQRLVRETTRIG